MSKARKGAAAVVIATGLISGFEGVRTYVYRDPVGVPTYCFGETRNPQWNHRYTIDECKALLADRVVQFARGMEKCIREPDKVPDKSYAAFLSITYNIGEGAWCKSSMVRDLNAGRLRAACDDLLKYRYAQGVPLPGLTRRRQQERAYCLQGAD